MPITQDDFPTLKDLPKEGMIKFGLVMWECYQNDSENAEVIREGLLETIRKSLFPDFPSRYSTLFATDNIEDARQFRSRFGEFNIPIWQLECENYFGADMNWFKNLNGDMNLAAISYWQQKWTQTPSIEYLLLPPINVIKQVE